MSRMPSSTLLTVYAVVKNCGRFFVTKKKDQNKVLNDR